MIVYAETNFVLEIALAQEQAEACLWLLDKAASGEVTLEIPSVSLLEPHLTLLHKRVERRRLAEALSIERTQLARSSQWSELVLSLTQTGDALLQSADDAAAGHIQIENRLLSLAQILPLDAGAFSLAVQLQPVHQLRIEDALVLACVIRDLERESTADSCFVTLDKKDLGAQLIVRELESLNCKPLFSFDKAANYVRSRI